jgi:2-methylcitrate dehydratase PrpD
MKLFSERFGELTSKVEELRTRIDVKPIREIPVKLPSQTSTAEMEKIDNAEAEEEAEQASGEEKQKRKRKPSEEKTDAKTEAEKRIDTIRSEVEKVLDKLGQMEIES